MHEIVLWPKTTGAMHADVVIAKCNRHRAARVISTHLDVASLRPHPQQQDSESSHHTRSPAQEFLSKFSQVAPSTLAPPSFPTDFCAGGPKDRRGRRVSSDPG